MRSKIEEYNAVVEAASKFTQSVAEGNSKYAKEPVRFPERKV